MTSTIKNVDANTDANSKTSLYELAKGLTSIGYLVFPVNLPTETEGERETEEQLEGTLKIDGE